LRKGGENFFKGRINVNKLYFTTSLFELADIEVSFGKIESKVIVNVTRIFFRNIGYAFFCTAAAFYLVNLIFVRKRLLYTGVTPIVAYALLWLNSLLITHKATKD
jgi:hypothetical protein